MGCVHSYNKGTKKALVKDGIDRRDVGKIQYCNCSKHFPHSEVVYNFCHFLHFKARKGTINDQDITFVPHIGERSSPIRNIGEDVLHQ